MDAIRRELSLGDGVERFASGSVPVFGVGDEHVVKLFPPAERAFFDTERAALARIDGRLPVPTPRAIAAGERGQWFYIVMTRLSGCSLAEAWPTIETRDRLRLMREVGEALAELHATATDDLAPLAVDWPRFMYEQRASCRDRQLAKGLPTPWVRGVHRARKSPLQTRSAISRRSRAGGSLRSSPPPLPSSARRRRGPSSTNPGEPSRVGSKPTDKLFLAEPPRGERKDGAHSVRLRGFEPKSVQLEEGAGNGKCDPLVPVVERVIPGERVREPRRKVEEVRGTVGEKIPGTR